MPKCQDHILAPGRLIPKMPQASLSDIGHKKLTPYFVHIVPVKFAHCHLIIILTEPACHHNSFWGSRCDSNHAPTISLKPCISFAAISAAPLFDTRHISPQGVSHHFQWPSSPFSDSSGYIFSKFITFRLIPAKTNLLRLSTQTL